MKVDTQTFYVKMYTSEVFKPCYRYSSKSKAQEPMFETNPCCALVDMQSLRTTWRPINVHRPIRAWTEWAGADGTQGSMRKPESSRRVTRNFFRICGWRLRMESQPKSLCSCSFCRCRRWTELRKTPDTVCSSVRMAVFYALRKFVFVTLLRGTVRQSFL